MKHRLQLELDIITEEFYTDLLAPVYEVYEDEKARILGEVS